MAPEEYRLSQDVLIFLIENQDSFLIGMRGTAADPETVRDVQSGTPGRSPSTTPTTPGRPRTIVARSASGASVGAESVRKWGNLRRNVSTSSRTSRQSDVGPTPVASAVASPSTPTSGVGRSNTVPSRRGGGSGTASPRFPREKTSDPPTPSPGMASASPAPTDRESSQNTPVAAATPQFASHPAVRPAVAAETTSSEATTPVANTERKRSAVPKEASPLLSPTKEHNETPTQRSVSNTSSAFSGAGGLLGIFKPSQTSDSEGRKIKKLQKKRNVPGSSLSSAQSSTQSLENVGEEDHTHRSPARTTVPSGAYAAGAPANVAEQSTTQHPAIPATPQRSPTDATLRPTASPPHSFHSQTDMSDADFAGDEQPAELDRPEKKRNRWRFSRSQNTMNVDSPGVGSPGAPIGTMTANEQTSKSTIGSAVNPKRRSFQDAPPLAPAATDPAAGTPIPVQAVQPSNTDPVFSDSEREKKGPMSWIRGKIQERKEKDAEKRTRTPDRNRGERHERQESKQDLRLPSESAMPVREKPVEAAAPAVLEPQINVQPASPPEPAHVTEGITGEVKPAEHAPAAETPVASVPAAAPVAEAAPVVHQAPAVHQPSEPIPTESSVPETPEIETPFVDAPTTQAPFPTQVAAAAAPSTTTAQQVPELTPQEAANTFSAPQPGPETVVKEE